MIIVIDIGWVIIEVIIGMGDNSGKYKVGDNI